MTAAEVQRHLRFLRPALELRLGELRGLRIDPGDFWEVERVAREVLRDFDATRGTHLAELVRPIVSHDGDGILTVAFQQVKDVN